MGFLIRKYQTKESISLKAYRGNEAFIKKKRPNKGRSLP